MAEPQEANALVPALLVAQATETTASTVEGTLVTLLTNPDMPEEMRKDTRARLADLYRRFPNLSDQD